LFLSGLEELRGFSIRGGSGSTPITAASDHQDRLKTAT
jgi:hypothetical protein